MKSIAKKVGAGQAQVFLGGRTGAGQAQVGAHRPAVAYLRRILLRLNPRLGKYQAQTTRTALFPITLMGKAGAGADGVWVSLL